jgi:hypothetical protein
LIQQLALNAPLGQVELFHHSRDVPATIANLIAIIDRTTGEVVKKKPRVLSKGISAEVQLSLRTMSLSGPYVVRPIPLEPFSVNKDMGRILVRRGGETIGAGKVRPCSCSLQRSFPQKFRHSTRDIWMSITKVSHNVENNDVYFQRGED